MTCRLEIFVLYVHAMILELCGIRVYCVATHKSVAETIEALLTPRQGMLDSFVESCYLYELNAGGDFAAGAA